MGKKSLLVNPLLAVVASTKRYGAKVLTPVKMAVAALVIKAVFWSKSHFNWAGVTSRSAYFWYS